MKFSLIEYDTDPYRQELALRDEVLRRPLGLNIADDDLSQESRQWHFGLFDEDNLIASVIAVPHSESEVQIRQMAVSNTQQGKGHGRQIMRNLESHLVLNGISEVFLHARVPVIEFYKKLAYLPSGGIFTEVGIPHLKMHKSISPNKT